MCVIVVYLHTHIHTYIQREGRVLRFGVVFSTTHPYGSRMVGLPGPSSVDGWDQFEKSFVYRESIKRELQRRLIYEYRCDERLKTKNEESTRLKRLGDTTIREMKFYLFIYYESTKRKLKTKYICECRCYERLQPNT